MLKNTWEQPITWFCPTQKQPFRSSSIINSTADVDPLSLAWQSNQIEVLLLENDSGPKVWVEKNNMCALRWLQNIPSRPHFLRASCGCGSMVYDRVTLMILFGIIIPFLWQLGVSELLTPSSFSSRHIVHSTGFLTA